MKTSDYKRQVIMVSDFTYRDYVLKSSLGHDDVYGGLLGEFQESSPKATFSSLEEHEKMLQQIPNDARAILDYERECGVEFKITLNYTQAFNIAHNMIKQRIPIEAFLFYRIIEPKHNLYEVLIDQQAGFRLYNTCITSGTRPGPIFVICSPRTDGKEETPKEEPEPLIPFDVTYIKEVDNRRKSKIANELAVIEKLSNVRTNGIVYLEDRRMDMALKLLRNIHIDPYAYGMHLNTLIRSEDDFLIRQEPAKEQEKTDAKDKNIDSIVDAIEETLGVPKTKALDPEERERRRQEILASKVFKQLAMIGRQQKK